MFYERSFKYLAKISDVLNLENLRVKLQIDHFVVKTIVE